MNATPESQNSATRNGVLVFVPEAVQKRPYSWRTLTVAFQRNLWTHVGIFVVCLALALLYILVTQPVYRAQVVVLPVSTSSQSGILSGLQSSGLGGLAGLAGINLDSNDDFRKEAMALLTSKDFAIRFINDEGLLPILFSKKWDAQQRRWRSNDSDAIPTIEEAVEYFDTDVRSVSEDRRSGLTNVSFEWKDRVQAAHWANVYVARANSEMRRRTIQDSQRSLEFLRRELQKTSVTELQQTLYRMMESEMRKVTLASVREEYAFRVIDAAQIPMVKNPVRPKRVLVLLFAISIAFLISSMLAWSRASMQ